jgi:AcrR family transcriptional regulator
MRAIIERMTGPSLRERKKAQTREAIIAAAIDLFERKGYDATTIDEIAEAADVSPRTFFRYFDSKVEVVMEHKDGDEDNLGRRLAERPDEESPVEAMCNVMSEALGQLVQENPLFVRQMRVMLGTPSLHALARDHFNEHNDEIVDECARRLDLPEDDLRVHVVASAMTNTIWTVVSCWVAESGSPERLLEMIEESCRLLSSGLDPRR